MLLIEVTFEQVLRNNVPQFGAWCAYAIAHNGKQYRINPKAFEIRDGRLYLFYKAIFYNCLEHCLAETPDELVKKGNVE